MPVNIQIDSPTFLGEMLESPEGLINAKNLLNEVFVTFFTSPNFCDRTEMSRADYSMVFEDLQQWIDACYRHQAAERVKDEMERALKDRRGKDLN